MRWNAPIAVPDGDAKTFTLALFFDECYLADTDWTKDANGRPVRNAKKWQEPAARVHRMGDPLGGSREERNRQRDQNQKARAALTVVAPLDERVFQARSTMLTMFLDQFLALAAKGTRDQEKFGDVHQAHVSDLGLVVYGPTAELEKLDGASIRKNDTSSAEAGTVTIFNPRNTWFDVQDPVLANDRFVIEPDGIKLDWRLSVANAGDTKTDPDHFIENYEVIRTIEGSELTPCVTLVKPVGTQGRTEGSTVVIDPAECQFLDTLGNDTGVTPSMRRALLPTIGEEEGIEAAQAWIKAFGTDEEVIVTYSVTPIDTAGVRGLPRSFVVGVPRPLATIHPAIGEIRAVQKPSDDTKTNGRQENDQPPPDLELYLAINDQAWSDNAPAFVTIGNDKFDVDRIYRLVIDPEDLEPAGHYGSDGATSRVRGPGAWAPKKTADERTFDINRKSTIGFDDPAIQQIEPEAKTLKLLRWAKIDLGANLNGTPPITIGQFLWTGRTKDVRVATRFSLETVLRFKKQNADEPPIEYPSSRVPLQIEHRIEASPQKDDGPQTVASLRPDALEWTVPLKLPPLGAGQIRAESGFARFRVPKPGARLHDASSALLLQRDADRRVLTTVTFSAIPDWAMAGSTKNVKALHGASLAGFDLYELDLDELAPLDVEASEIAKNAKAWQRARRVARIQQLSRDDAQLVPADNADWQGWQAHYPSETQRLINARTAPPAGDSKPVRSAWYSDRESAAYFAERRPRLRLLPAPPENAIAALMQQGSPTRIVATVVPAKGGSIALPRLKLHRVDIARDGAAALRIDTPFLPIEGDGSCKKVDGTAFNPKEIRHLLLALGWEAFADADADKWRKDPSVLDGVTLTLRGDADFTHLDKDANKVSLPKGTGSVDIPLDLRSPMHPLLEEILGELSYDVAGDAAYRRFVVMPQPFTPMGVKDFDGFMAGTAPEADPYGWKILQAAGCATTVRLFDRDQETFVAPSRLYARVNDIVSAALDRWKTAHGNNYAPITAQPFAELFLRPGADRLAGPFDAIGDAGAPLLEPDDEALAFVQLSLRPRPAAVWHYMQQKFKFGKPVAPDDQFRIRRICIRVPRKDADLDVARARGGAIAEVTTDTPTALIEMPQNGRNADELTIFFRTAGGIGAGDRPTPKIVVEREQISDGSIVSNDFDLGPDQPFDFDGEWTPEISVPGSSLDPFARFDPASAEKWADALTTNATAMAALRALQETLFAAMALTFSTPKQFVAAWVTWQQRLLDHAAVTTTNDPLDTQPFFALAAPVKASPWKLAADAEGSITLTFLHSDRWAHARVYAVKPIGRYHELLGGILVDAEQKVETFDAALPDKIGYAVAVSPRTERIEPPVIVKSSLVSKIAASDDPENFVTELIVARHGEESLANSNRTLFARLGVPSSLLAFSRSYRLPKWPDRLKGAIGDVLPDTLPERTAQLPARVDDVQIDGAAIRALADEYPGLWKGADIWRIAPIPPHYRLIALASERAGIVVSDVVKVVQEEQPRRRLQDHQFAEKAIALSFIRDGSARARLVIRHPLISHADLTPEAAKGWLGNAKAEDVCWWPDPDVVYVLLRRRSEDKNKTFVTEEEDAEVRLVAQADDASGAAIPIVVRTRGTRYTSEVVNHDQLISVTTTPSADRRDFTLDFSLRLRNEDEVATLRLETAEFVDETQIKAFNDNATPFAAILTPHRLTIEAMVNGATPDDYRTRLGVLRQRLQDLLTALPDVTRRWMSQRFLDDFKRTINDLAQFLQNDAPALNDSQLIHDRAKLPFVIDTPWLRGTALPFAVDGVTLDAIGIDQGSIVYLAVWDFVTDTEVATLRNKCSAPVAQTKGRLYTTLLRRLMVGANGLWLRAVDGRARITFVDGKPKGTPGVVEAEVTLPPSLDEVKEGAL
ncbi:MAG TPA: hypothetical protein VNT29_08135 [Candidatus Limnocylindrales bacterium]|nr:hypothetical protein [Candidatus Limnocylindrales bacterium]